jgi:hypothetical protein
LATSSRWPSRKTRTAAGSGEAAGVASKADNDPAGARQGKLFLRLRLGRCWSGAPNDRREAPHDGSAGWDLSAGAAGWGMLERRTQRSRATKGTGHDPRRHRHPLPSMRPMCVDEFQHETRNDTATSCEKWPMRSDGEWLPSR